MGTAINTFLRSLGSPSMAGYTGAALPGAPPTETTSAEDKAKFDESVRKYQLDRKAYEQYADEYRNRVSGFNIYDDPQFSTTQARFMPKAPTQPTVMGQPDAPATTAPLTQLRAPTYGAISQFSNLTPQQQGELYLQQRGIGYTDADIRKATAAQVGTPSEEMMAGIYKAAYPQYTQAIESQYGTQFNRTGYGSGANQIDYPGFNYYINQLSTGAVTPDTLESAIRGGAGTTTTPGTTPGTTTPGATTPASDINALYQQYFNRQADPAGLQYWQQSGLTGDALKNAIIGGAQGNDLYYYNTNFTNIPTNNPNVDHSGATPGMNAARGGYINRYAHGGEVRTHYQAGGPSEVPGDPLADLDAFYRNPAASRGPAAPTSMSMQELQRFAEPVTGPVRLEGMTMPGVGEGGTLQAEITPPPMPPQIGEGGTPQPLVGPTAEPTASTQGAATPAGGGSLQDMLARYMRASTSGGSELADARRRYQAESDAFYGLIRQTAERGESPTSRAEMYFRLASAFGSPTRTGSMGETLSKVGEQMSEYTKGRRADEAERRNLMVQAQQARMAGAREDLTTTRALAAQEATERRALNAALLQEYIRSGRPQSRAGQMAIDAGLTPGTQAFQDYVRRHSELDIQRTEQLIQAQNENIALRRDAADRLSATEIKMADETTQNISSARDNAILLREAIRLNPNASPSNLTEGALTEFRARLGSTDPLVVNTRDIRNILNRLTLGSLKETFPGSISNDERTALAAVSGVTSSSREERARIMQRASDALDRIIERNQEHLRKIRTGEFGRIDRTQGGTQ